MLNVGFRSTVLATTQLALVHLVVLLLQLAHLFDFIEVDDEASLHLHRQDRKEDFSGYCWVNSCLSLKRKRQQLRRAQDERRGTQEEDRADLEEA